MSAAGIMACAGRAAGAMTITDNVSERIVRLPLYYGMTGAEQARVIAGVSEFYQAHGD